MKILFFVECGREIAIKNMQYSIVRINAEQDIREIQNVIIANFIDKYEELKNNEYRYSNKQ